MTVPLVSGGADTPSCRAATNQRGDNVCVACTNHARADAVPLRVSRRSYVSSPLILV